MKKYLYVVPLVLLFYFTIACQDKAATTELEKDWAQAAVEKQNIALHAHRSDTWRKGDIAAWKEMVSSDFIWHYDIERTDSLEKTIELMKQYTAAPDRSSRDEDVFAKGDRVVIRYTVKYAFKKDVDGFPTKGKTVEGTGNEICE